jgi:hypothetical protein
LKSKWPKLHRWGWWLRGQTRNPKSEIRNEFKWGKGKSEIQNPRRPPPPE